MGPGGYSCCFVGGEPTSLPQDHSRQVPRAKYTLRFSSLEEVQHWRELISGQGSPQQKKVLEEGKVTTDEGMEGDGEGEGVSTHCGILSPRNSAVSEGGSEFSFCNFDSDLKRLEADVLREVASGTSFGAGGREPKVVFSPPDFEVPPPVADRRILPPLHQRLWLENDFAVNQSSTVNVLKCGKDVRAIFVSRCHVTRREVEADLKVLRGGGAGKGGKGASKSKERFVDGLGIASGMPGEKLSLLCIEKVFRSCVVPSHAAAMRSSGLMKSVNKEMLRTLAAMEGVRLRQFRAAGIPCPEVIAHLPHMGTSALFMEFLGEGDEETSIQASPNLGSRELPASFDESDRVCMVVQMLALYKDMIVHPALQLVHGDAAGENFVFHQGKVYVINVGQAIPAGPVFDDVSTDGGLNSPVSLRVINDEESPLWIDIYALHRTFISLMPAGEAASDAFDFPSAFLSLLENAWEAAKEHDTEDEEVRTEHLETLAGAKQRLGFLSVSEGGLSKGERLVWEWLFQSLQETVASKSESRTLLRAVKHAWAVHRDACAERDVERIRGRPVAFS
uniref:non-specific serine/threonine protein kinase n=1 Tax=Chromera velia CCMP2878 TaxID=1169474 RepID=A0A0G4HX92_9ALVE|eukprot:Cvel_9198.t1-p1 / transcript=Cvel_9198.t1 / gene=Cvel_9198 / organism=Chromera_velia_CCMP2878 / gene_product=Serine/threonine-protein kinase RIO1, putative / transcript_product=Serine/threonine-protein kinase RIO1, putative / location=Cvel_scaffold524:39402-41425(-) / protein_length=561 / sequence_SO=supercontig / SO=protein_coding / is_pseudo=false